MGLEVSSGGSSSQTTIKELSVTENGTYNAGSNAAYNPVTVNVPSGGGGEDKLLCYKISISGSYTYVVYTDKPATKIQAGETGGFEQSILPVDDGKHLFITNSVLVETTVDYAFSYLIYEDGSPATDLKGKFIYT